MKELTINNRKIGGDNPAYIVAEMSANHNHDFEKAAMIINAAKQAGADAVKLQTYTPDTITIDCDNEYFKIKGTIWEGKTLYELYDEAFTPWEWYPKLKSIAADIGIDIFSSPFDSTAVDFLEDMNVPAYKVASFEIVDIGLLKKIASTRKPVIISTGMATDEEIKEAVKTVKQAGGGDIVLLKCTSAYPASPEAVNLKTIPHMAETYETFVGLSDHTLSIAVPVAAIVYGACIIEKHFILSRKHEGPDNSFSLEPDEFKQMTMAVREAEKAIGEVNYNLSESEKSNRVFRRSLFIVENVAAGEKLSNKNVRSIRPGHGLHPRYLEKILGKKTLRDVKKGTPLTWDCIQTE